MAYGKRQVRNKVEFFFIIQLICRKKYVRTVSYSLIYVRKKMKLSLYHMF